MEIIRRLRPSNRFEWMIFGIIFAGTILRVCFWLLHMVPPKVYFIFNPQAVETIPYLFSFESSHPLRMPYYDVIAYWFYLATERFVGLRAVALFDLLISIVALPVFYAGVRNLFDRTSALYALCFLAFYPKMLVLTSEALPEVAAVSFVTMSLYPLGKAIENERPKTAVVGGATATLGFLMFDPAVAFLGLTVLVLYAKRAETLFDWTAIDQVQIAYTAPGAVAGILYVVFGPFFSALSVVSGGDAGFGTGTRELFLQPEILSLPEKVIRFFAYTYFDFWWPARGFDTEEMVLTLLTNISEFFGALFPMLITGWATLTLVLTVASGAGIIVALQRRTILDVFVLVWFAGYMILFLGTNLGWQGAFQTRHVLPIFPAIAILFGIGVSSLTSLISDNIPITWVRSLVPSKEMVPVAAICLIFTILLLAALGQVVMLSDNTTVKDRQPVETLDAIVGEGEQVAIVGQKGKAEYREIILYSGGRLRPVVLTTDKNFAAQIRENTVAIDVIEGSPPDLITQLDSPSYLYLQSKCSELSPNQRLFRQASLSHGGTVVHESQTVTGQVSPCEVNVVIVRVNGTTASM